MRICVQRTVVCLVNFIYYYTSMLYITRTIAFIFLYRHTIRLRTYITIERCFRQNGVTFVTPKCCSFCYYRVFVLCAVSRCHFTADHLFFVPFHTGAAVLLPSIVGKMTSKNIHYTTINTMHNIHTMICLHCTHVYCNCVRNKNKYHQPKVHFAPIKSLLCCDCTVHECHINKLEQEHCCCFILF